MSFAKKCLVIPALGFVLLMASFVFINSDSSAKVKAIVTENPFKKPTEATCIDSVALGAAGGTVQFARINTSTDKTKTVYSNYLYAGASFTTNNTPVDLFFAIYDNEGKRVDNDKYTTQTVAAGKTFQDVVRLENQKAYCITVYAKNEEKVGDENAASMCNIKVEAVPDDVGDLTTTATPIEMSLSTERIIQGHPDVDCFSFVSPGTAVAVTVQNLSDKADDKLTVRFADKNGNEMSNFNVEAGKIETKEIWKLEMQGTNYVFISAPNTKGQVKYSVKVDPITRRIEYVLGTDAAENDKDNPFSWTVGQVINLKPATRAGYMFDGWYKNSGYSEDSLITTINESITEDLKLFAKWTKLEVGLPMDIQYTKSPKSVTFTFTKAEKATYTVFKCNGKTYKTYGTSVKIKGLGRNRRYPVKIQSVWKLDNGQLVKSPVKTVRVRTTK